MTWRACDGQQNPTRAEEPHALPDCEVYYFDEGEWQDEDGEPCEAGWYYCFCFPGCLPDSDPYGPYETEEAAIEAAREGVE